MAKYTTIARNDKHDIYLNNGKIAMTEGKEAYAQIIEAAILTVKGEVPYDSTAGIGYFETCFRNPNYIPLWEEEVKKKVSSFPFVNAIQEFSSEFNPQTHKLSYSITISTDDGTIVVGQ